MGAYRVVVCAPLLWAAAALAAAPDDAVRKAAERVRETAAKAPPEVGRELCGNASKALAERYPELAARLAAGDSGPKRQAAAGPPRAAYPPEIESIRKQISQMRRLPTDADRARLATEVSGEIRALPPGPGKLMLARSIAGLVTEGDLGKEALTAVAGTLADAARETPAGADVYLEIASLIRFEGVRAPMADPALDAADAVLALQQALVETTDFTLPGLDGRLYSLSGLRGKVVLLNFWATWCPPCRKEMPDMEILYNSYRANGLIVLAVSDEARDTVTGYLANKQYTFPILLDPDHKVHNAFGVNGIPKSFVFGRDGHLAAQAIDMRSERQFRELLRQAGL